MEQSTSISDLPIDQSNVSDNPMQGIPDNNRGAETSSNIQMDPQIVPNQIPTSEFQEKQVNIREDKNVVHKFKKDDKVHKSIILEDDMKIIILATIMFFVFQDSKVRNYVMNILCQIFGKFLKTDLGNISKIGIFFYSIFYGMTIFIIVKVVDVKKFNLNF